MSLGPHNSSCVLVKPSSTPVSRKPISTVSSRRWVPMRRRRPNKSHEQDAKRSKECNKWTQYLSITCMCQSEDRKAEAERKTNRHNCLLIAQSTRGTLVDSSKEGDLLPSNLSSVNAEDGEGEKDRQSLHAAKRRNDPANSRAEIEGNAYTPTHTSPINGWKDRA
jgi:hypothetical protein